MKKLFVAISLVLFLASCEDDDGLPGGDDRDKFLGTWNINANGSQSGHLAYTIEILAGGSGPNQVNMKNFDFQGTSSSTLAEADGNSLIIEPDDQVIGGDTISGSGNYSNGQLTFNYTVRDGITVDVVTATGTR